MQTVEYACILSGIGAAGYVFVDWLSAVHQVVFAPVMAMF